MGKIEQENLRGMVKDLQEETTKGGTISEEESEGLPKVYWPYNSGIECINQATEELKKAPEKASLLEAKNADACNTISDLLAQMECLQVANRNLCTRNETLQERVKNLKVANENLIANEENLRNVSKTVAQAKEHMKQALSEARVTIQKLQKKNKKLKKKNKLLAKATLC